MKKVLCRFRLPETEFTILKSVLILVIFCLGGFGPDLVMYCTSVNLILTLIKCKENKVTRLCVRGGNSEIFVTDSLVGIYWYFWEFISEGAKYKKKNM